MQICRFPFCNHVVFLPFPVYSSGSHTMQLDSIAILEHYDYVSRMLVKERGSISSFPPFPMLSCQVRLAPPGSAAAVTGEKLVGFFTSSLMVKGYLFR